jgi:hypothetical protein
VEMANGNPQRRCCSITNRRPADRKISGPWWMTVPSLQPKPMEAAVWSGHLVVRLLAQRVLCRGARDSVEAASRGPLPLVEITGGTAAAGGSLHQE